MPAPLRIFFLYPSAILRREIFQPGTMRYRNTGALYGADRAADYHAQALDDLDIGGTLESSRWGRFLDRCLNGLLQKLGGTSGDWYKIYRLRPRLRDCDVILSTTDRVGIPLLCLMYLGILSAKPVVYVSIGLPERLVKAKPWFRNFLRQAFHRHVRRVIAYGAREHEVLHQYIGDERVVFIPFGIDTQHFKPSKEEATANGYLLSIGADSHRDFDLLLRVATSYPGPIRIVTLKDRWNPQSPVPSNVEVFFEVPYLQLPDWIEKSRFVVLPVRDNSYSGATTTLLQCMAMGKAVIVSQTAAIATGYNLKDGDNILWVPPGDTQALSRAMARLAASPDECYQMGARARQTVQDHYSYERYCQALFRCLHEAVA